MVWNVSRAFFGLPVLNGAIAHLGSGHVRLLRVPSADFTTCVDPPPRLYPHPRYRTHLCCCACGCPNIVVGAGAAGCIAFFLSSSSFSPSILSTVSSLGAAGTARLTLVTAAAASAARESVPREDSATGSVMLRAAQAFLTCGGRGKTLFKGLFKSSM